MSNAFIRKLECYGPLRDDDRDWLQTLSGHSRGVNAGTTLIHEGDRPDAVRIVLDGFAARYKSTVRGDRQLFAYLVPGDFCDLHVALLDTMDHSIAAISNCQVALIPRPAVLETIEKRPQLAKAFWWCSLVDAATLREWVVNVGQRPGELRIAHLFCELHVRLEAVGETTGGSFELPITQVDLGDTVGLSAVHVNRSLKVLRAANLVTFQGKRIVIPDVARLKKYAGFDPSYLHLRMRAGLSEKE